MLVKNLIDHYDYLTSHGQIEAQYGWAVIPVSYLLDLNSDGTVRAIKDVTEPVDEKGKKRRGTRMVVPMHTRRGNSPMAFFLCDNAKYMLGIVDGKFDHDLVQYTKTLHHTILNGAKSDAAKAVLAYMNALAKRTDIEHMAKPLIPEFEKGANILLSVNGVPVTQDACIRDTYNAYIDWTGFSGSTVENTDLITGEKGIICRIHLLVKGVASAPNGAALCFSNAAAFDSQFGGKQGYGFPMTEKTAYKYVTALNHLTASKDHNVYEKYSGVNVVAWSADCDDSEQALIPMLAAGTVRTDAENGVDGLKELIGDMCGIDGPATAMSNPDAVYHIVGLDSKEGYSIRVRFEYDGTAKEFMDRIRQHFIDTDYVGLNSARPVTLQNIMAESVTAKVREATSKKYDKKLALQLLQSILEGEQYPFQLVDEVIRATCADILDGHDFAISPVRMGFLRGYVNRLHDGTNLSADFDPDCTDLAYLCGRATVIHERLRALYAKNDIMESDSYVFVPDMLKMPHRMMTDLNDTIGRAYMSRFKTSLSKKLALHYIGEIRNILEPIYPRDEAAETLAGTGSSQTKDKVPVLKHLDLINGRIPPTFSRRDMAMFLLGYSHEKYCRPKDDEYSLASEPGQPTGITQIQRVD